MSPKKRGAFLASLADGDTVKHAAAAIGLSFQALYKARDKDTDFASEWAEAAEQGTQALEQEAKRRAVDGTLKPVYQGGVLVGHVQEYSDTLLIFLLKARRPATYRENLKHEHEVSGPGGGPIPVQTFDYNAALASVAGRPAGDP